jgi:hypothetical protein
MGSQIEHKRREMCAMAKKLVLATKIGQSPAESEKKSEKAVKSEGSESHISFSHVYR